MAKRNGRPVPPRRATARLGAIFLLAQLVVLLVQPVATASPTVEPPGEWTRDLATLKAPYNEASAITVLTLSESGDVLVLGTDNGAVLFLNATTGEVIESAETSAHGAVHQIVLDASGTLAVIVYEDGYVAAIGTTGPAPLLTLEPRSQSAPRPTAAVSRDGRFLVLDRGAIELYHLGKGEDARFKSIGADPSARGTFLWLHPKLLVFGALTPDGTVNLYSYDTKGLNPLGTRDITSDEEQVTALAVSGDGNRFAVALANGDVRRYTPSLNPEAPQLIPDYHGNVGNSVLGLALDQTGQRLAAWSPREVLWVDGCNRNEALCDGKTTEKDTVRLRPPGFGTAFGAASVTPDLSRALVQVEGERTERRLYNLPGLDHFVMDGGEGIVGVPLLSPSGTNVFIAEGTVLQGRTITAAELAPPAVQVIDGSEGSEGEGDGPALLGLSTEVFLIAGIGALALLLLVVLGSVFMAMRRGTTTRPPPLPSLAPASDEPLTSVMPPPAGALGARPGNVRSVAPSAPATAPPPEGLLVLQHASTSGARPLVALDLTVKRPEVLRIVGARDRLDALATLLGGRVPFHGTLAVGGASARDTPTLYERRVRVGLDHEHPHNEDAAALFRRTAAARGLPLGLVERRMEKDLGWMGERLHRPLTELRPLDQWKVRLALALVDRPHLIVLRVEELPWNGKGTERVDTVRRVLGGVARHYETLVVLLDDGVVAPEQVRRVADEEVHLGPSGFKERRLLEDGHPVAPAARPAARRRGIR